MIALIDGDLLCYRIGFTTEQEDLQIALYRMEDLVGRILDETHADSYKIYLTDSAGNFRQKLFPDYKANRTKPKPIWLEDLKEFLIVEHGAEIALGMEADDALGIAQVENLRKFDPDPRYWNQPKFLESVICSIDKDLLQIPGNHYNFVKQESFHVTPYMGMLQFYTQLLVGDVSDNVVGAIGIGPKKAEKALNHLTTEIEMFEAVRKLFKDDERLLLTGRLLKILQSKEELTSLWNFPRSDTLSLAQSQEEKSLSTISGEEVPILCMEPTGQEQKIQLTTQ